VWGPSAGADGLLCAVGLAVAAEVPFVGCPGNGQLGPVEAETGKPVTVALRADVARRLALYSYREVAVLAPRGWACEGRNGSGGTTLLVSPGGGVGVEAYLHSGGASGRMAIAEIVARVFPAHRKLARDVEALFPEFAKRWAWRPYPADRLTYLSDRSLRYRTPGTAEGLGTQGSLGKGAGDVAGYVALRLGDTTDLWHVAVRLPDGMRGLVGPILDDAVRR
jgi:hypothetical protein